jgi:hypothetical protein
MIYDRNITNENEGRICTHTGGSLSLRDVTFHYEVSLHY